MESRTIRDSLGGFQLKISKKILKYFFKQNFLTTLDPNTFSLIEKAEFLSLHGISECDLAIFFYIEFLLHILFLNNILGCSGHVAKSYPNYLGLVHICFLLQIRTLANGNSFFKLSPSYCKFLYYKASIFEMSVSGIIQEGSQSRVVRDSSKLSKKICCSKRVWIGSKQEKFIPLTNLCWSQKKRTSLKIF